MHFIPKPPPPKPEPEKVRYYLTDASGGNAKGFTNIHLCNLEGFLKFGMSKFRVVPAEEYSPKKV